ncbi:MAG TPA: DNA repair protein RadC [Saprospiraceae bacterium]|nr:DNA repair protein RadC [Saprospiraceae bacterium]
MNYSSNKPIKTWAAEDRPREKLAAKGPRALTNAELIAILIGSGNFNQTAVELAQDILAKANNNLAHLSRFSLQDLMKFKGIGEAKAITIASALEIGRRRLISHPSDKVTVRSSRDSFEAIKGYFFDLNHEEFWIFLLNRGNQITHHHLISKGGVAGTVVDIKLIFKYALDHLASGLIIAHNHPSGSTKPSKSDQIITNKVKEAGKLLDINLLDHLILAGNQYYSFSDSEW